MGSTNIKTRCKAVEIINTLLDENIVNKMTEDEFDQKVELIHSIIDRDGDFED